MGSSIVYTNDNCIGCNKCINVCSAIGACISKEENGKARIEVDGKRCVACGSCIDVCVHGAREFVDDSERFFSDLKNGEPISILLAPAFKANYPEEYARVLGGLKALGVKNIISVSFGADITTWGYLNYMKKYGFTGGISQPCPAVVSYIERYLPELLDKLFPVQSPLMCAAIYARKQLGITDRFAFISPCIAKKMEIEDPHNAGLVQYNVTFDHLMRYVRKNNCYGPATKSDTDYGLGSFYPTPGGLEENVRWFLGDQVFIRQIEGERRLYDWMHRNKNRIRNEETPFLFIDALNCENGCICGTATDQQKAGTDDALYALLNIREESKKNESGNAWSRPDTPEQRLAEFNESFKDLVLEDYLRGYTDRSAECRYMLPDEEALEAIFASMNKLTPESRQINCTCCGYESCMQMATAIYNGFNHKENCIYYEKTMVHELEVKNRIVEEATRAKSAFLANMSHEIRTPINAVLGMNEMILRESRDKDILSYSETIKSAGTQLLGLVNDILDFTKIEDGRIELNTSDYDLSAVLNDLVGMVRGRAEEKGLELNLEFDPEIPRYLNGDELRLKQIMANILTNAVKYTEKGSVTFRVGYETIEQNDHDILLIVSVKDTGIGIKEEDMPRLFERFGRIEEKRNRHIEGTGLGLSITLKLLELMGSTLDAKSTYGEGSEFSFKVRQNVLGDERLKDYEAVDSKPHGTQYRGRFVAPKANILAIDDNAMNLEVFKNLLKQTQIRIDTAESGDEGLALTREKKYDIIFFDHMMPGKDGVETLHELRAEKDNPNLLTPAVCLTANAIIGAKEFYLAAGFDVYLTKPVDVLRLENTLLSYIPREKIEPVHENGDEGSPNEEDPRLIMLSGAEWMDVDTGLKNSGSEEAFMKLLKMFCSSAEEKAEEIDRFYTENDIKNYTIKVHALKSSARLIGATAYGEKAQQLENAGKSGDMAFIGSRHEGFIKELMQMKDFLLDVFRTDDETANDKPLADEDTVKRTLEQIREAADAMDCDALEAIFDRMEQYRIPDEYAELFKKAEDCAGQFDYDGILKLF